MLSAPVRHDEEHRLQSPFPLNLDAKDLPLPLVEIELEPERYKVQTMKNKSSTASYDQFLQWRDVSHERTESSIFHLHPEYIEHRFDLAELKLISLDPQ